MDGSETRGFNKPLIRWAGSKRQIVGKIAQYCGREFERYVEPFAGSCALFFELRPKSALLADKNRDLIEAYEVIQSDPARLHGVLVGLPRRKGFYYAYRELNPKTLSKFERAVRFLYLNRYCFNGIYRTNTAGQFNVPFSASKTGNFPGVEHFESCANQFKSAELRSWDFGTTLRYVRNGDLVYMDPPYAVESRRVFREYGAGPFASSDLKRLEGHLHKIADRGAVFFVSYADCSEARRIGRKWNCTRIRVRRNVAGFEGARKSAYELLISNLPLHTHVRRKS